MGGWYIILKDDKGNVYAKSEKTPTVEEKTEQSRTLQIPVNINGAPIVYNVEVHHEKLLPEAKFSQKHFFRNTQQAGYKLTLVADGTSSSTPTEYGGEGALLSSIDPLGKRHELFFKYGSLYGIKSYIIDGKRPAIPQESGDTWSQDDIAWYPITLPPTVPTAWSGITGLPGAFTHSEATVKTNKGDPCKLVGLNTSDIAKGKVENGEWKMATTEALDKMTTGRTTSMKFTFVMGNGASIVPFGYRNKDGKVLQQTWQYGGPYAHAVYHSFNTTLTHFCAWFEQTEESPVYNVSTIATSIGQNGFMSIVGAPNIDNALSIRCIRIRK